MTNFLENVLGYALFRMPRLVGTGLDTLNPGSRSCRLIGCVRRAVSPPFGRHEGGKSNVAFPLSKISFSNSQSWVLPK